MPITELALLRVLPPATTDDASLRSKLAHAKDVMEKYTGRRFYYLQQVEDPAFVYIVGEWESLDQHMNGFIPSPDNQALLESLKDDLVVEWMFHIEVPHAELPLPKPTDTDAGLRSGITYSIGRHFIKAGESKTFQKTFDENKHFLQEVVTEGRIGGGWRVDKDEGKEEFVLWCPWTGVEQHFGFAETDGFKEYARIRESVDGADIKHAKLVEL